MQCTEDEKDLSEDPASCKSRYKVLAVEQVHFVKTASGWPDYRLQDIHGLSGIDPNLFFLPPVQRGLRWHSYKVLQGESHR